MNHREMKNQLILCIILIMISFSSFYFCVERYEYFEDEVTSYGVANNGQYMVFPFGYTQNMEVSDLLNQYIFGDSIGDTIYNISVLFKDVRKNGVKQSAFFQEAKAYQIQEKSVVWREAEYFRDYLTVQSDERFLGWKTYIAAIRDVHPPLYFILLNGICSLNPEILSRWQAFSINLFCMIGTCCLLYRIIRKHYADHWCGIIVVLVYGLSTGYMSTMYLYRPYALLTFLTVAFFGMHIELNDNSWEISKKKGFLLICITILGYLTQYYFIFSAIVMFVISTIYMIRHGYIKCIKRYVLTFVMAAGFGLLLWPFSIYHIFFGDRGTEALGALHDSSKVEQFVKFLKIISENVFIGYGWFFFLACMVVLSVMFNKNERRKVFEYRWMACICLTIFSILASSVVSPYATVRYVASVFPFLALLGACVFYRCIQEISNKSARIVIVSVILVLGGTLIAMRQPDGFYRIEEQEQKNLSLVQDGTYSCIYVYGHWHEYMSSVPDFINYRKTLLLQGDQLNILSEDETVEKEKQFIVYVSGYDKDKMNEIIRVTGYDTFMRIADKNWATVYLMERN